MDKTVAFSFSSRDFDIQVYVDIITGGVYKIPSANWSKEGNTYTFKSIPVYDSPILIIDSSLILIK